MSLQLARYIVALDKHRLILGLVSSVDRLADLSTWYPNLNSPRPEFYALIDFSRFKAGWLGPKLPQHNVKCHD